MEVGLGVDVGEATVGRGVGVGPGVDVGRGVGPGVKAGVGVGRGVAVGLGVGAIGPGVGNGAGGKKVEAFAIAWTSFAERGRL